jgi:hypothetical protein
MRNQTFLSKSAPPVICHPDLASGIPPPVMSGIDAQDESSRTSGSSSFIAVRRLPLAEHVDHTDDGKASGNYGISLFRIKTNTERRSEQNDPAPCAVFREFAEQCIEKVHATTRVSKVSCKASLYC